MGRARQLSALLSGSGLGGRLTTLESWKGGVDTSLAGVNTHLTTLDGLSGQINALSTRLTDDENSLTQQAAAIATLSASGMKIFQGTAEQFTNVPIGQSGNPWVRTIYYADVANVKAGDLYLVMGQGEIETQQPFRVEGVPALSWTAGALTTQDHAYTNHVLITPLAGRDFSYSDEHYMDWRIQGAYKFVSNIALVRFHASFRCNSSDASPGGANVVYVKQGYGNITVIKLASGL